jgi:hypothetical protein
MRTKATGKLMAIISSFGITDPDERNAVLSELEETAECYGIDDYRTLRVMVADYLKEKLEAAEMDNDSEVAGLDL